MPPMVAIAVFLVRVDWRGMPINLLPDLSFSLAEIDLDVKEHSVYTSSLDLQAVLKCAMIVSKLDFLISACMFL